MSFKEARRKNLRSSDDESDKDDRSSSSAVPSDASSVSHCSSSDDEPASPLEKWKQHDLNKVAAYTAPSVAGSSTPTRCNTAKHGRSMNDDDSSSSEHISFAASKLNKVSKPLHNETSPPKHSQKDLRQPNYTLTKSTPNRQETPILLQITRTLTEDSVDYKPTTAQHRQAVDNILAEEDDDDVSALGTDFKDNSLSSAKTATHKKEKERNQEPQPLFGHVVWNERVADTAFSSSSDEEEDDNRKDYATKETAKAPEKASTTTTKPPSIVSNKLNQPQSEFDRALTDVISSARGIPHKGGTTSSQPPPTISAPPASRSISSTLKQNESNKDDAHLLVVQNDCSLDEMVFTNGEEEIETALSNSPSLDFDQDSSKQHQQQGSKRMQPQRQHASSRQNMVESTSPPPPPPPYSGNNNKFSTNRQQHASNPSQPLRHQSSSTSSINNTSTRLRTVRPRFEEDLSPGVLPDVLMTMRQKIESLTLFDSDMIRLAEGDKEDLSHNFYNNENDEDNDDRETKESLRRSFQQSISAAVLVSLAHKRYERRRLAAMEIEKVVRSLVQQHPNELDRVRAILLLLSDDYVRSTSEDARKGGVVALAACAIGLKKANTDMDGGIVNECKDLILASVVHACQDNSQRVRYYATESLFNVIKVLPILAVQHFFILFEILRSLYADVDVDVRSGAELLDKKLKEVIVGAINSGSFTADACVPLFARFVYMRNKPTKRLTLTWLQEFSEKLIGAPVLEFLHLFLEGVFAMVADPNSSIRQLSLQFLSSILPKLLMNNEDFEDASMGNKVDFDKILQSLVTTMEHPDPFVRKVAMYWMSRIVQAHMEEPSKGTMEKAGVLGSDVEKGESGAKEESTVRPNYISAASLSVRNSLPHVLPGILLSIGDDFHARPTTKDSFLPDQTTYSLAEQTNACLQNAVKRDGKAYVAHLYGFIVSLREELDTPGGLCAKNPPALERKPYRMDVKSDGTGIESTGWFRASEGADENEEVNIMSRLCALQWITVLYEHVVPDMLKAEYTREFIIPVIHQLIESPPELITFKSLEVLAKITIPVEGEQSTLIKAESDTDVKEQLSPTNPTSDVNTQFALDILDPPQRRLKSRNREVFATLIHLHSRHYRLLSDLSKVIRFMCSLQPPEFVFVSFALELDRFANTRLNQRGKVPPSASDPNGKKARHEYYKLARDLDFVSKFVQVMNNVLLTSDETKSLRAVLKDSIACKSRGKYDERRSQLLHILLYCFAHNLVASISLCLWSGAYLTASTCLHHFDPLDVNLMFYLELDQLIELLERPLFRDLHLRMLECDEDPGKEGSGAMLYRALKSILMLIPQSTSYAVLKERLLTISRFRQSAVILQGMMNVEIKDTTTEVFVKRILQVRALHCDAKWRSIRSENLEPVEFADDNNNLVDEEKGRRDWLGYASLEEEKAAKKNKSDEKKRLRSETNKLDLNTASNGTYKEFSRIHPELEGEDDDSHEETSQGRVKSVGLDTDLPGDNADIVPNDEAEHDLIASHNSQAGECAPEHALDTEGANTFEIKINETNLNDDVDNKANWKEFWSRNEE